MIVRLLNTRPRVAQRAFGEIRVGLCARKQRAGGLSEAMQAPIGDGALAIEPFLCGLPVTEAAQPENVGRALDAGLRVDDRQGRLAKRAHELAGSSARLVTLGRECPQVALELVPTHRADLFAPCRGQEEKSHNR